MAERLSLRIKRVIHSITERSAIRMVLFLVVDSLRPATVDGLPLAGEPPPGYAEDALALDNLRDLGGTSPIIFQTWKSRSQIPVNYRYWRQSFVRHNPDKKVILWDDNDNRTFIADRFPWFLNMYDDYPHEIYRADAVRYFFLFEFGGLYADLDSECLRPISATASVAPVVLCRMGGNADFDHSIPNAVMASAPRQLFWLFVIQKMIDIANRIGTKAERLRAGPEVLTGPVLLKSAYDEFTNLDEAAVLLSVKHIVSKLCPGQVKRIKFSKPVLLYSAAWYPLDWTNLFQKTLCNRLRRERRILPVSTVRALFYRSSIVTYWSHSW